MIITWYGTASVLIETSGTSILFDPFLKYLPESYEPEELRERRETAFRIEQNILITHGHLDHLSSVPFLYQESEIHDQNALNQEPEIRDQNALNQEPEIHDQNALNQEPEIHDQNALCQEPAIHDQNAPCTVYLTNTPARTLTKQGFPESRIHRIAPGDILQFSDITVRVYHGKHVHFDAKLILHKIFRLSTWKQFPRVMHLLRLDIQYRQNNEIIFFEIEAEGKRVQIMGSADLDAHVEYPTGADVLILPHQGRSDMDAHNREIVRKLKPKRVLLDHYDDAFPPISELVPVDEFCRKMSEEIPTEKMVEGKKITI